MQGWLLLESAGAKRLHELLKSSVPVDGVLRIICGYYTMTPEEMKRSMVLNAADDALVAMISLAATVKHRIQSFPGDITTHHVNLESLQAGLHVDVEVVNYFLLLLEEQTRNAAAEGCCDASIPRVGVLPSSFTTSNEILGRTHSLDQSIRRRDWLGWCAARNWLPKSLGLDLIMFPVSFLSMYALGVINRRKRYIQVYHTLGPNNDPYILNALRNRCALVASYMRLEAGGYAPCTEYDEVWEVKILYPREEMVLAGYTLDEESGVSLCMHAYYLAFGLVPDFTREAFPGFRRRMVRNLLVPRVLYQ